MSAQPHGGLVRKQFLVTPLNVEKLQRLAEENGTSAAEIVRKAIDAYEPRETDEMESPEAITATPPGQPSDRPHAQGAGHRERMMAASWKDILLDMLKLTDEVKRLNERTEKLSDRTLDIDKRLVRLETLVEMAQKRLPPH